MFCKKCGKEIKNGTFCPACGTNNAPAGTALSGGYNPSANNASFDTGSYGGYAGFDTAAAAPASAPASASVFQRNKWLLPGICAGAALLIVIIAAAAVFLLLSAHGSRNTEKAVEDYFSAYQNKDAGALMKCVPKDFLSDVMDEYHVSRQEIQKELQKLVEDRMEDSYDDEIETIAIKYIDAEEAGKYALESYKEDMEYDWDYIAYDFEFDDIEKMIECNIKLRYDDEDGEKISSETIEADIFKYGGKWYYDNAMYDIVRAAMKA